MNWFQKITVQRDEFQNKQSQISATGLPGSLWYHGTDSRTAYSLMSKMILEPRSESGESSYVGSISSIPSAVYLTLSPGKAAKHAIERAEQQKTQPVVLVIQPEDLGNVHVDEDMVHTLLNGHALYDISDWYPSPTLEKEVFDLAAEYLQVEDWDSDKSNKALVLEHLQYQREYGGNEEIEDEFLEEEGIIPTEKGDLEYDSSMHAAKDIAKSLNDKHQREAIVNFQSMAHDGSVRASEIYLIPWNIDRPTDSGGSWKDSPTSMRTHEELVQFGEQIDPQQLMMPFMTASSNWFQKISNEQDWDDPFDKTKNDMFETGRPAEFNYLRNTETSPDMGEKFQQHIEPAGRYLIHDEIADGKHSDIWESGMAMFDNPLVIKFHSTPGEVSYSEGSWKMRLSRAYNGLGGIELSRSIIADGHDGIVTIKIDEAGNQETSEIVDLRPIMLEDVK